jgi:hypothetical protein
MNSARCRFNCTLFDIEPKRPTLPGKVINSALQAGYSRVRVAATPALPSHLQAEFSWNGIKRQWWAD